jgi:transposase
MLSEARPEHPNLMTTIRHVAGMLGMSPETFKMWQRRYEVDADERPGVTSDVLEEIRMLELIEEVRSRHCSW